MQELVHQGFPGIAATSSKPVSAGAAHESAPSGDNPMRKVVVMVGLAIAVFVASSSYSIHKSIQSRAQLTSIKDLYFPVLQKTEANIVRLDKMEELFMRSVMMGDHDPIDDAQELDKAADQAFAEMLQAYPERKDDITALRREFQQYDELATRTANDFLAKKGGDIKEQTQHMNATLEKLRGSIKQFRTSSFDNFVRTLGDSQQAVAINLYMGMALGVMNLCFMGVLVFFIRNNIRMMGVIAEQNALLERRVAERTAQLRQKTLDIQAMLQNMPQGVMTVMPGGVIHPEYSAYMETIFETKQIAGASIMGLVFSDTSLNENDLSQVDAALSSCIGEDMMNYEFNSHLLVAEFNKRMANGRTKSLELSWSPICSEDGNVEKLMLCVRDVTELKRLANEAGAQKRELEIIGEILAVSQEKFHEFIDSARKFIAENEALLRQTPNKDADAIGVLFRNMHTIKGNARTYGLTHMINTVHMSEQAYDELRKDPECAWNATALLAQLQAVHDLVEEYSKTNDLTLGRKGPGRRGSVERFHLVDKDQVRHAIDLIESIDANDMQAMRRALDQVADTLNMIGSTRIEEVVCGIVESLPSLAQELGKEAPQVNIQSNGLLVRNHVVGLLKNVFTHVFRNSVDHGLESAQERTQAGKPGVGRIDLALELDGEQLLLRLRDDGRGLALGKIRQKAIAAGLIQADQHVESTDLAQYIFASGFSTADKVTEVSGRGVGMDAVRGFLRSEGGDVRIAFTDDQEGADWRAFELVISLPAKFGVKQAA